MSDEKSVSTPFPTGQVTNGVQMVNTTPPPYTSPIPDLTPPTPSKTLRQLYTPRTYEGVEYYGAEDVAKIIGVSKPAVIDWHKKNLFTADKRAHDGRYLYTVERVEQLKSVYHPKWMRGGYEPSPTTTEKSDFTDCQKVTPPTVDLEQFLKINKINAGTLSAYGFLTVTKFSNKNRMEPSRFKCPFCGGNELTFYENGGITKWKCDCFNGQTKTNADIFAKIFKLDVSKDRDEIYRRVTEKISVDNIQRQSSPKPAPPLDLSDDEIAQLARDKIAAVQGTLRNLPEGELRGFDGDDGIAFLESFKIGVDLRWAHPKMPNSRRTKRFVMPLGDKDNHISYNAIMTHEDRETYKTLRESKDAPKWVDKCLTVGRKYVFNPSALKDPRLIVPTFEGEFDALAVMYSSNGTIPACALGGAGLRCSCKT